MTTIQSGFSPTAISAQNRSSLTSAQKEGLTEVLSKYDPENLSDSDAKALVNEIETLGIQPGRGLASALRSEGIDAGKLAQQAGVAGPGGKGGPGGPGGGKGGPGGPGGAKGPDSAAAQTLQSILEELEESDSEADFTSLLLQKLEEANIDTSSSILDFTA